MAAEIGGVQEACFLEMARQLSLALAVVEAVNELERAGQRFALSGTAGANNDVLRAQVVLKSALVAFDRPS